MRGLVEWVDGARRHVQRFYARLNRSKEYGQSRLGYIGAAPTPAEATRRLAAAVVDCPNASSGTRRKWARAVARLQRAAAVLALLLFAGPVVTNEPEEPRPSVLPIPCITVPCPWISAQ